MALHRREVLLALVLVAALISTMPLTSAVPLLEITPENATIGEDITVTGSGFGANAEVNISTTVTCYKPVVEGKCECTMTDFELPVETDFKLSVRRVTDNVSIHVKVLLLWLTIDPGNPLGFIFSYNGSTQTSYVSRNNVPPGEYSIDVIGDAVPPDKQCTMITSASMMVQADGAGNFSESLSTRGIPLCNFIINASSTAGSDETPLHLFRLGDVSMDGQVNAYDCCCIARYLAHFDGYDNNTICYSAADVNCDSTVEWWDAKVLAESLIGLRSPIPEKCT